MPKTKSLCIFFLCAGFGKRLRPLTSRIPKPLITFQGKSALKLNFEKIKALEPNRVICNSHYLPEFIAGEANRLGVEVIHEKELMGTGGCLGHAKEILSQTDYFLMHNGDILHSLNLAEFVDKAIKSGASATLAAVNSPSINTLEVDRDNRLAGVKGAFPAPANAGLINLTYCGIGLYHKSFLNYCLPVPEELKHIWAIAVRRHFTIAVRNCSGEGWYDFGSPISLMSAAKWHMTRTGSYCYHYSKGKNEERPYVSNEAEMPDLPGGLRETLILEATEKVIPAKSERKIWGMDFCWDLKGKTSKA